MDIGKSMTVLKCVYLFMIRFILAIRCNFGECNLHIHMKNVAIVQKQNASYALFSSMILVHFFGIPMRDYPISSKITSLHININ